MFQSETFQLSQVKRLGESLLHSQVWLCIHTWGHTHTHTFAIQKHHSNGGFLATAGLVEVISVCVCMCVCVWACVCVCERKREGDRLRKCEREWMTGNTQWRAGCRSRSKGLHVLVTAAIRWVTPSNTNLPAGPNKTESVPSTVHTHTHLTHTRTKSTYYSLSHTHPHSLTPPGIPTFILAQCSQK